MIISVGAWTKSEPFNPTGTAETPYSPARLSIEHASRPDRCVGIGGNAVVLPLAGSVFGLSGYTIARFLHKIPQELTRHHVFSDERLEAALRRMTDPHDRLYELVPRYDVQDRSVAELWARGLLESFKYRAYYSDVGRFLEDRRCTEVEVCNCPSAKRIDVVVLVNAPVGFDRVRPVQGYRTDLKPLVVNMWHIERTMGLLCGVSDFTKGYPIPRFVQDDHRNMTFIGQSFAIALLLQLVGPEMLVAKVGYNE